MMDILVDDYENFPWPPPAKVPDVSENKDVDLVAQAYVHRHI